MNFEHPRKRFLVIDSAAASAPTLSQACQSLWLATLSLMTAFMHTAAPAHRYLLARRIARNFDTLRDQPCYTDKTRADFAALAHRWQRKAEALSPTPAAQGGMLARLQRLFAR
jgi:hypothetical protein